MRAANAVGALPAEFAQAPLRDPLLLGATVRYLLDFNFEQSLHDDICAMTGIDLEALEIGPAAARTRDRLRANPADLELYASTKRELGRRTWKYPQNYADAKIAIVEQIIARATHVGSV